jgi:hypothetical protein
MLGAFVIGGYDMEKKTQIPKESSEDLKKRYRKGLDKDFEKMLEMKFADFRKEAVECFKNLYAMMLAVTDVLVKEKERFDDCVDVLAEKLHERDELIGEAFKERDEKLDSIACTVMLLSLKAKKGPVTLKDREAISESLGYKWGDAEEDAFCDAVRA